MHWEKCSKKCLGWSGLFERKKGKLCSGKENVQQHVSVGTGLFEHQKEQLCSGKENAQTNVSVGTGLFEQQKENRRS